MESTPDSDALIKQIGIALVRSAPEGWRVVKAEFRATGRYYELSAEVTDAQGTASAWTASHDIALMFARLRSAMHAVPGGTWFNARYQVEHPAHYNVEFDRAEPRWRTPPPMQAFRDELRYFPRAEEDVPEWLVLRMSGLPADRERDERRFRVARIFDAQGPGGRPTVNRPPVPEQERDQLRRYLDGARLVLPVRGNDVDRLSADGRNAVPVAFHSDGTWVWPAAVNYYFARYGLPPEADLVEHARSADFTVPEVDDTVAEKAAQTITGGPKQGPAVRQGATPPPGGQGVGESPTDRMRRRLDELGVPHEVYRVGEAAPGMWHLTSTDAGWQVGWSTGGQASTRFADEHDAAAFLLGKVVLGGGRPAAPAPSAAAAPQPASPAPEPEQAAAEPSRESRESHDLHEPAGAGAPEPAPDPAGDQPPAPVAAAAPVSQPAESPLFPPAGAFAVDVAEPADPATGFDDQPAAGDAETGPDAEFPRETAYGTGWESSADEQPLGVDGEPRPPTVAEPEPELGAGDDADGEAHPHWEPEIDGGTAPEVAEAGGSGYGERPEGRPSWLDADDSDLPGAPDPEAVDAGGRHEASDGLYGGHAEPDWGAAPPQPCAPAPSTASPADANAAPPSASASEVWRQWRLSDDPPAELFRGKNVETLPAGTEVDRYGSEDGNLTYAAGTPFELRSLPQEWADRDLHTYRLLALVDAVTGSAVPWFDQPGGGTGYLLPRSIADLLADGVLEEL